MTIEELLVRDGYWPTTDGPKGTRQKWYTVKMGIDFSEGCYWSQSDLPGAIEVKYKPEKPTDCSGTADIMSWGMK